MAENKQNTTPERRPDCVTEIRMGNTVLVVSGFFKKDTTDTAADKMMKVLEAEAAAGHKAQLSPQRYKPHRKIVILPGGKEAEAAIQTAAPCGIIEIRNSGAGCRKRRILC